MQLKYLVGVAALVCAQAAQAQGAGSNVIEIGWFHIAPQESSGLLTVTSPSAFAGPVPGTSSSVNDADTLGITYTRFFTDHIAGEIVAGIPPRFRLRGENALKPVGELGNARQWSPSVLVKYFFGPPSSKIRPHVGIGLSYVRYTDVEVSDAFQSSLSLGYSDGAIASGRTEADIDSRLAPVFNVGVSYELSHSWALAASLSYLPLKTTAHLRTRVGGTTFESESKFKLNPIVGFLGVAYRF